MTDIEKLLSCVRLFREADPEIPSQAILLFLSVADQPGHPMHKYVERCNILKSRMSRNVSTLSRWRAFNTPGLDLIEVAENPHNRREKQLFLTPKGQRLVTQLLKEMHR